MTDRDPDDLARQCAVAMYRQDSASQALGIQVEIPAAWRAEATMTVTETMVNGHDLCHGGLVFTLADTAFAFACNAYDKVSVAASATIEFLAPARLGDRLTALACERRRGHRSGIYDVEVSNQHGECIALFRGRCATRNRPLLTG